LHAALLFLRCCVLLCASGSPLCTSPGSTGSGADVPPHVVASALITWPHCKRPLAPLRSRAAASRACRLITSACLPCRGVSRAASNCSWHFQVAFPVVCGPVGAHELLPVWHCSDIAVVRVVSRMPLASVACVLLLWLFLRCCVVVLMMVLVCVCCVFSFVAPGLFKRVCNGLACHVCCCW
jgi:hypothetical protein